MLFFIFALVISYIMLCLAKKQKKLKKARKEKETKKKVEKREKANKFKWLVTLSHNFCNS